MSSRRNSRAPGPSGSQWAGWGLGFSGAGILSGGVFYVASHPGSAHGSPWPSAIVYILSIVVGASLAALKLCLDHNVEKARISNSPKAPEHLTSAEYTGTIIAQAVADAVRSSAGTGPNENVAAIFHDMRNTPTDNGEKRAGHADAADHEIPAAETLCEPLTAEQTLTAERAANIPGPGQRAP
jgi:hypothetical protein